MSYRSIYLTGFMGSGKSVVGKLLASRLNLPFVDLDSLIEKESKLKVAAYFDKYGEAAFRKKELEVLAQVMARKQNAVVALGGGTFCSKKAIKLLQDETTVYLIASLADLTNRLWTNRNERPLISTIISKNLLSKYIKVKLRERRSFYRKAKIRVRNNATAVSAVERIRSKLS